MTLQLTLAAITADPYIGCARANLSDPDYGIDRIEFYTTVLPSGQRSAALPSDRLMAIGVSELDVLRDATAQIKVELVAVLADNTVVQSTPAFVVFDPRSAVIPAPSLRSLNAFAQWWRIQVSCIPGGAAGWKCWVRKNAWPTADNTPSGTLLDEYIVFEGHRDKLGFDLATNTEGDTYNIIAAGFTVTGVMGERKTDSVRSTLGPPKRVALTPAISQTDGVEQRIIINRERLKQFTDWLTANNAKGFIGEFGWPNPPADWNAVAAAVFADFNAANLWATSWAVGEMWGNYKLAPYVFANGSYSSKPQSSVLELPANVSSANFKRGVNVAGAEFAAPNTDATSSFSNANPGVHGQAYIWNGANTYNCMYARGHRLVRICFRWERLQPTLGGPLDSAELQRMHDSVTAAAQAGLEVILDMHNYGAYYLFDSATSVGVRRPIGVPLCTITNFANAWGRIAAEFNSVPAVIGYGLMNEPVDMVGVDGMTPSETWATAAQAAVNAIRAATLPSGQQARSIMVAGYEWGGTWSPDVNHPTAFISDPANLIRYEAHLYFDFDSSGQYSRGELNPTLDGNWVRWEPNVALWEAASSDDNEGTMYDVEVARVSDGKILGCVPLWKRSVTDEPVFPCDPTDPQCQYKNYEYRIVAVHKKDGTTIEAQASISGPYL